MIQSRTQSKLKRKNTNQSEDDQALVWRIQQGRFWSKSRCIYCWEELVPWTLRIRNEIQVYMASQFQYLEKVKTKKFNSKNLNKWRWNIKMLWCYQYIFKTVPLMWIQLYVLYVYSTCIYTLSQYVLKWF